MQKTILFFGLRRINSHHLKRDELWIHHKQCMVVKDILSFRENDLEQIKLPS